MEEKKTVMKKKRHIKTMSVLILLGVLLVVGFSGFLLLRLPTKNIFIHGNTIVSDKEIIELAGLSDYPGFLSVSTSKIERRIEENPYIDNVTVKRGFYNVFDIYVEEAKPLFIKELDKKLVLENKKELEIDNSFAVPRVLNYIPDTIYDEFVKRMAKLDKDIIDKISEIEYTPGKYDDSRFLLYMIDGNYVYVMLLKLESLNYYNDAYPTFEGKKGTWYLDSGGHFVIFKK